MMNEVHLCQKCFEKLNPVFKRFRFAGCKGLAIYHYDDYIRSLIYQLKTNMDVALAPVFLERYLHLKYLYLNYVVLIAPSHISHTNERGFKPVEEIFKVIGWNLLDCFSKSLATKQIELNSKKRKEVKKYISLNEDVNLRDKKVLLVDDIMTTGSTIEAMVDLVRKRGAKKIEILVLAKNELKEEVKKTNIL